MMYNDEVSVFHYETIVQVSKKMGYPQIIYFNMVFPL